MDRKTKLLELKFLIESGAENMSLAVQLERFFLGTTTSTCNCKFPVVKSALNRYWEHTGKKELETYE